VCRSRKHVRLPAESALKRIALDSQVLQRSGRRSQFLLLLSHRAARQALVRVCLGTGLLRPRGSACSTRLRRLKVDVGETTPDASSRWRSHACFGACGLTRRSMIDEEVHHRVKPSRIELVLAKYRNGTVPSPLKGVHSHGTAHHDPRDLKALQEKVKARSISAAAPRTCASRSIWAPAASPPAHATFSRP